MDAAVYKHVVLGLIFLKYISDAFEQDTNTYTDAKVYYGAGRTFSVGMKIKF